jgi:hypothetical protein
VRRECNPGPESPPGHSELKIRGEFERQSYIQQGPDEYGVRIEQEPETKTHEAPHLFDARVTQLVPADRLLAPNPDDTYQVVRRIVDLVNLNVMEEYRRMSAKRIMKLEDFSVTSIVVFLINQRYRSFSVESIRAIVKNSKAPVITMPGRYRRPTRSEEAERSRVYFDTRRRHIDSDISRELDNENSDMGSFGGYPTSEEGSSLLPRSSMYAQMSISVPGHRAYASPDPRIYPSPNTQTYTGPDPRAYTRPDPRSHISPDPRTYINPNLSWEPEASERRVISNRLAALANLNVLNEDQTAMTAKHIIYELADKRYNMREVLQFFEQRGYAYSMEAVRMIMEEPRTALLAPKRGLAGEIIVPKVLENKTQKKSKKKKRKTMAETESGGEENHREAKARKNEFCERRSMPTQTRITKIPWSAEEGTDDETEDEYDLDGHRI